MIGKDIPEDSEPLIKYSLGILIFAIIALSNFFNVLAYFLSLYILDQYEINKKYPPLPLRCAAAREGGFIK